MVGIPAENHQDLGHGEIARRHRRVERRHAPALGLGLVRLRAEEVADHAKDNVAPVRAVRQDVTRARSGNRGNSSGNAR